jgi:hypothetical protein
MLSFFSFGHCAVLQMTKGKKGQNRQTVISNTAQWPKEKKDKMTTRDQQYSTMGKEK